MLEYTLHNRQYHKRRRQCHTTRSNAIKPQYCSPTAPDIPRSIACLWLHFSRGRTHRRVECGKPSSNRLKRNTVATTINRASALLTIFRILALKPHSSTYSWCNRRRGSLAFPKLCDTRSTCSCTMSCRISDVIDRSSDVDRLKPLRHIR